MTIGFLYIIDKDKYLQYYKKGFIKYMPQIFLPLFKPVILEKIKKEEIVIGKVGAVNLKSIDFNSEEQLNKFIKSIEKIQDEDCVSILMEEYIDLDSSILETLKKNLNIFSGSGMLKKIVDLPIVIRKIFNILNEDIKDKEVLILSDDKEKAKEIIKELAKDIRFITVYGLDEEEEEELYQYILYEIGLSIYHTKDFYNTIENYSVVINLIDRINLSKTIRKKDSIVFDFSSGNNESSLIKDYGYDLKDLAIKKSKWFGPIINTKMIEFLLEENINNIKPKYLITKENNYYTFKEYVELFIKIRGRF